jgi:DNA-binding response OmpR family regulator
LVKVLLADDDVDHLDMVGYILRREGFVVSVATDGRDALRIWEDEQPDIVLLDLRMPTVNGFEVLRTVRQSAQTPVIIVSACADEDEIVRGLQSGADDYITKPFNPRQLVARVRAVLRRSRNGLAEPATEIAAAGMILDMESHEVRRGDHHVRITPLEFRILYPLMLNVGRVVASSRLVEQAWGYEGGDANVLKTHISHLRKKLHLRDGTPGYIEGIPGLGYVLRP